MPDDGRIQSSWAPEVAQVVANERRGPDWFRLALRAPRAARLAVAGHFIQCAVVPVDAPGTDLLAKRPFSVCQIRPAEGQLVFIYRAGPGRGTLALSRVAPGQELAILGPLGRSFPHPWRLVGRRLALVGGGMGIPPLVAAAEWAAAAGVAVRAICAARTASALAGAAEMAAAGVPVTVMTDDGSTGRRGLASDPLAQWLADHTVDEVWACGPEPMLAAVQSLCRGHGLPAWLAVERPMGCGFGACMSCTVPAARPEPGKWYLKCCTDGPVLSAGEVVLGE